MSDALDPIPLEEEFRFQGPDNAGQCIAMFYAFNTVVTLQAFAEEGACRQGFKRVREACRKFERLFSRTLPHSDIARINDEAGSWVEVSRETFELLDASRRYCAEGEGVFDITIGTAMRLWDFHEGIVPDATALAKAITHVNWRNVEIEAKEGANGRNRYFVRLADEEASLDVGGTAKGYIADAAGEILLQSGVESFIVNLGGNVLAHGRKPDGQPWMVGIQDPRAPRDSGKIVGAIPLENASAVTSGTYERRFERDGKTYHHILNPKTGLPVDTDIAGATVIARRSIDAEGYSTTLLALGESRAVEFIKNHPVITAAYLADSKGAVFTVINDHGN